MNETIELLLTRRSVVAGKMSEPGPTDEELDSILKAGLRVPDHGKLGPWRFIVIRNEARALLGEAVVHAYQKTDGPQSDLHLKAERERFLRAPLVIAVVSRVTRDHKIPEWEQILSSGAACQNMLIASHALGYTAQWITEWYSYNSDVHDALELVAGDELTGFIYVGTASDPPKERVRADIADTAFEWLPEKKAGARLKALYAPRS